MATSLPKPPSPAEALALIQRLLSEPDCLSLTHHLRQRSHERHVDVFDIRKVLETGCVTAESWDENRRNWKYRVSGRDTEGDPLTIIVVLEESAGVIKVITAYD